MKPMSYNDWFDANGSDLYIEFLEGECTSSVEFTAHAYNDYLETFNV